VLVTLRAWVDHDPAGEDTAAAGADAGPRRADDRRGHALGTESALGAARRRVEQALV
jgi:hypothetical protein